MSATDTANQVVDDMYSTFSLGLTDLLTGDLAFVATAFVAIFVIIIGSVKIRQLINMSSEEKDARKAFKDFNDHRDDFDAPIFYEEYRSKLDKYKQSSAPGAGAWRNNNV